MEEIQNETKTMWQSMTPRIQVTCTSQTTYMVSVNGLTLGHGLALNSLHSHDLDFKRDTTFFPIIFF